MGLEIWNILNSKFYKIVAIHIRTFREEPKLITIWIRMALDKKQDPFEIGISINGQNAEGYTETIMIDPSEYIKK